MDRLKVKAKRLDNGEWVEGNLVYSKDAREGYEAIIIPVKDSDMFTNVLDEDLGIEKWFKVQVGTICQCTGVKLNDWSNADVVSKLVYEGDMIRSEDKLYIAKWDEEQSGWLLVKTSGDGIEYEFIRDLENDLTIFIGNIHD